LSAQCQVNVHRLVKPHHAATCAPPKQWRATSCSNHALQLLRENKRHSIGLVAGTGLSAEVTADQAGLIQSSMDVWGMNQFFFHNHLVPRFFNLEFKTLTRDYVRNVMKLCSGCAERLSQTQRNVDMWRRFFVGGKRVSYRNTVFLAQRKHALEMLHMLRGGSPCPHALVVYDVVLDGETSDHYGCTANRLRSLQLKPLRSDGVTEYCSSSITRVLELMLKVRYSHIAFLGVDLNSPHHFYSSYAELGYLGFDRAIRDLAEHQHGSGMHSTGARGVSGYISLFASGRNVSLLNLAPSSLLANATNIRTLSLSELQNCTSQAQPEICSVLPAKIAAPTKPSSMPGLQAPLKKRVSKIWKSIFVPVP